jgi:hypothetical protein
MRKWGFKKWGPEQGEKRKNIISTNNIAIGLVHVRKRRFRPTKVRFHPQFLSIDRACKKLFDRIRQEQDGSKPRAFKVPTAPSPSVAS